MAQGIFDKYVTAVEDLETVVYEGTVSKAVGLLIESKGPLAGIGEMCRVIVPEKEKEVPAEVVGFKNGITLLFPYDNDSGIKSGLKVVATGKPLSAKVGDALLGRVINTLGNPMDDKGPVYRRP